MKKSRMQPIRFDARQVALMVRIALFYDSESILSTTGHSLAELRAMAEQKDEPSAKVLDYFRLEFNGSQYVWDLALENKSNPCWGPILIDARPEVLQSGAAIRHSVETVESAFVNL